MPKTFQRLCQILAALREAGPWYRNRYGNRTPKGIKHGNSNGPDPGIMFAKIKSKVLPSGQINLLQNFGAVHYRVASMRRYTFVDEGRGSLRRITGEHGLSVCGAMEWKTLTDGGEGDQPLPARDLVDEDRRSP
jgi:hypothetical protein